MDEMHAESVHATQAWFFGCGVFGFSAPFLLNLYTIDSLSLNYLDSHVSTQAFLLVIFTSVRCFQLITIKRVSQIRTATRFVWYFFVLGSKSVHTIAMVPNAMLVNYITPYYQLSW
jgi:hypothetical protein